MSQNETNNPSATTKTPITTTNSSSSKRNDLNVIETLKAYKRSSQINNNLSIDSSAMDHDVAIAKTTTHENGPKMLEPDSVTKMTRPIYNNELIDIIDNIHSNVDTKATHDKHWSSLPSSVSVSAVKNNLIDFNDCQFEHIQSTESTTSSAAMVYEELSKQNRQLIAENADLKQQIQNLERQKEGLEEAAVEARVLVFEVAERHDMIIKLKNEINEMEQQLKQKDTHIQFKDEIIKKLRLQRRSYLRCPHDLGKTKLDSIDKVVDLIRTVSRDISPDATSKDCDCYNDFYQEKENQTDEAMWQSIELGKEYARKIEAQQTEIELLNAELDKKEASYARVTKAYTSLQQQLESINSINPKSVNNDSQVGKTVDSTGDGATVDEYSTAIADKTHLANLISSLKSELASSNALLKSKEKDFIEAKDQVKRFKSDLSEANNRVAVLEKQCENYRQTIKHMDDHLKTHSDTIKRLEENQSILKSQIVESQEKQQNFQKLIDENRKLDTNLKHQLTTISFLRTALEDHLKANTNNTIKSMSRSIATNRSGVRIKPTAQTTNSQNNSTTSTTGSNSTASNQSTSNHKWTWFK